MVRVNNKISVIIPTYNREGLVIRAVQSVLNQSYRNIEVIVVDDHSTDNTEERIKEIKDKRLKYIKLSKNNGACYARNVGIFESSGEYVAFQDSDDVFHVDKLERQFTNLINSNSDLDFCKIGIHAQENIYYIPSEKQDKIINEINLLDELCKGNFISTQSILVRREVLEHIFFDPLLPRLQDYDLVLRIVPKYKVSYTRESLVDLYRQDDNISNSYEKLEQACYIMIEKNYCLSELQKDLLIKTLIGYISKSEFDK